MLTGRPRQFELTLTDTEHRALTAAAHSRTLPYSYVRRTQIILRSAAGESNTSIAHAFGPAVQTVGHWRRRFHQHGLAGLSDAPRSGHPRTLRRRARRGAAPDRARLAGRRRARTGACARSRPRPGSAKSTRAALLHALRRAAAPHESFKPVHRPALRREAARRGGAVPQPAGQGAGALRGREEPDPGARAHAAHGAAGVRATSRASRTTTSATARPRCSPRSMCATGAVLAQCKRRHRHQEFLRFLRAHRRERAGRPGRALRHRQLRHPQARRRARVAGRPAALPRALHARRTRRGSTRSSAGSASSRSARFAAPRSAPRRSWCVASRRSLPRYNATAPARSPGPPRPSPSSRSSNDF